MTFTFSRKDVYVVSLSEGGNESKVIILEGLGRDVNKVRR
jgi:hypothetical protein